METDTTKNKNHQINIEEKNIMANTENKKLSGIALWWAKRSIKNAAIKEVKERFKREELERKNRLNNLKKQDKALYNEALKEEKAKGFLRKAGLSCMLKRAEKQAMQKMADQGLTLTKSEEMTRISPIKYSNYIPAQNGAAGGFPCSWKKPGNLCLTYLLFK